MDVSLAGIFHHHSLSANSFHILVHEWNGRQNEQIVLIVVIGVH